MTFDTTEHKEIVWQCINQMQFPGSLAEVISELKTAINEGGVSTKEGPK